MTKHGFFFLFSKFYGVKQITRPGLLILEQRAAPLLGREREMLAGPNDRRRRKRKIRKKKQEKKQKKKEKIEMEMMVIAVSIDIICIL